MKFVFLFLSLNGFANLNQLIIPGNEKIPSLEELYQNEGHGAVDNLVLGAFRNSIESLKSLSQLNHFNVEKQCPMLFHTARNLQDSLKSLIPLFQKGTSEENMDCFNYQAVMENEKNKIIKMLEYNLKQNNEYSYCLNEGKADFDCIEKVVAQKMMFMKSACSKKSSFAQNQDFQTGDDYFRGLAQEIESCDHQDFKIKAKKALGDYSEFVNTYISPYKGKSSEDFQKTLNSNVSSKLNRKLSLLNLTAQSVERDRSSCLQYFSPREIINRKCGFEFAPIQSGAVKDLINDLANMVKPNDVTEKLFRINDDEHDLNREIAEQIKFFRENLGDNDKAAKVKEILKDYLSIYAKYDIEVKRNDVSEKSKALRSQLSVPGKKLSDPKTYDQLGEESQLPLSFYESSLHRILDKAASNLLDQNFSYDPLGMARALMKRRYNQSFRDTFNNIANDLNAKNYPNELKRVLQKTKLNDLINICSRSPRYVRSANSLLDKNFNKKKLKGMVELKIPTLVERGCQQISCLLENDNICSDAALSLEKVNSKKHCGQNLTKL